MCDSKLVCKCAYDLKVRYAMVVVCQSRNAAAGLELIFFITEGEGKN
jgi:hypothetical protein